MWVLTSVISCLSNRGCCPVDGWKTTLRIMLLRLRVCWRRSSAVMVTHLLFSRSRLE